jgi:uncharacterized RDD family membrane protein YckC
MMETQDAARKSGFLSEEDKRRFTTVAGILGAGFFLLQMFGPMVVMFPAMPLIMARSTFETYSVARSALYQGNVHVVARTQGFDRRSDSPSRSRLVAAAKDEIQQVLPLDGWEPDLLADGDRLWLLSSSRAAILEGGRLAPLPDFEPLGDICRPFLLRGAPAVIENRPDGGRLLRWEEGWKEVRPLPDARGRCAVEPLVAGDRLWLFRKEGDTLYAKSAEEESADWVVVMSRPSEWYSFVKDGRPAVVSIDFENGFRLAELDSERWRIVSEGRDIAIAGAEVAAFQERPGSPILLLTSGFPSSLTIRTWDGGRILETRRFGRGFPFPSAMMWLMAVPQVGAMLLSLLLAVILAGMMRKHRITTYTHGADEVSFASLTRRALSEIIDAVIMALPGLLVVPHFFGSLEEMFEAGPRAAMLPFFGLFAGWLVWMGAVFLAFSFAEGRWGTTPGKWLLGIRVVGTDLAPCGFARALMRNALRFVDGFFNFLVGILLVAFTPEWQRIGDLAARTLVIRVPDARNSAAGTSLT